MTADEIRPRGSKTVAIFFRMFRFVTDTDADICGAGMEGVSSSPNHEIPSVLVAG